MGKQVINRYNVCAAKEYTNSQNERKTQWVRVGTAVMFDDGTIMQNVDCLPTGSWWDGTLQLFKQEARDQPQNSYSQPSHPHGGGYGDQPYGAAPQGYQPPAPAPVPASQPPYNESPF